MSQIVFCSKRSDGLGGRLRALVNAIALAEKFDARFSFAWPLEIHVKDENDLKFHAIDSADAFFGKAFLENHFRDKPRTNSADEVLLNNTSMSDIQNLISEGRVKRAHLTFMNLYNSVDGSREQISRADIRKAFSRIVFSDTLEAARQAANSIPIPPNAVAVHMRAGDIVYGKYRIYENFTKKAVPITVIRELIRRYKQKGATVLIFGEDQGACRFLEETEGVLLSSTLSSDLGYTKSQLAIFDITLMSRCSEIISGTSAFSIIAAMASEAEMKIPSGILTKREIAQLMEASDFGELDHPLLSGCQIAFAYWYTIIVAENVLTHEQKLNYISLAIQADPQNFLLRVTRVCFLIEQGEIAKAEAELQSMWQETINETSDNSVGLLAVLKARAKHGSPLAPHRARALFSLASPSHPYAALTAYVLTLSAEHASQREALEGWVSAAAKKDAVIRQAYEVS